jgi:hypothetical protein
MARWLIGRLQAKGGKISRREGKEGGRDGVPRMASSSVRAKKDARILKKKSSRDDNGNDYDDGEHEHDEEHDEEHGDDDGESDGDNPGND